MAKAATEKAATKGRVEMLNITESRRALRAFRVDLQNVEGGGSKQVAIQRFRMLADFWRTWQRRNGRIEDALVVCAYWRNISFDANTIIEILFVRLILGMTKQGSSVWGKALHNVNSGVLSLDDACRIGLLNAAKYTPPASPPPSPRKGDGADSSTRRRQKRRKANEETWEACDVWEGGLRVRSQT